MGGPGRQVLPESARKRGPDSKVKVAYITAAGVIVAALISGLGLYLTRGDSKSSSQTTTMSNNHVVINEPPPVTPPPPPRFQPFHGTVTNLPLGQCADVFSEPYVMQQDVIGTLCTGAPADIYCTVETTPVGGSSVWDLIYFKTNWGTGGYIPDYYVNTGSYNAVEPSCST
jgi:hypothetical protein